MNTPSLQCFAVAIAVLLAVNFHTSDAKRGCTTFGHSCYGGMGKRGLTDEVPMEIGGQRHDGDEEDPALVFTGPRSEYRPPGQDQIRLSPQQLYDLSPFLRQWLKTLNKMEEQRRSSNEN